MAGSVVGHGISNMLFGSGHPVDRATAPPPEEYAAQARQQTGGCDLPAKGEFCFLARAILRFWVLLGSYFPFLRSGLKKISDRALSRLVHNFQLLISPLALV